MSTSSTDLHDLSLAQLAAKLKAREVSSVEAAQHFLARAKAQSDLGAYVHINEDVTLAQAKAADAAIAAGSNAKLAGVPIAHKDLFVTKEFPTTAGSKMLTGYQSPFDATMVTKLAEAGCVTLGKLNMDEFAMGSANENSAIGKVLNPWDKPNETFDFRPEHLDELKALDVTHLPPAAPQLLIVATGDEVLDWRDTVRRYPQATVLVHDGGDHGLSNFADYLPEIAKFLH